MEKKFARLLIQLFAEEESETTDSQDEAVNELEDEFTDDEDDETSDEVEETTNEPEKVKTLRELLESNKSYQDEMNDIIEGRVKRERNKLDRDYRDKLSKYEELAYLTQTGLKTNDLEETLTKSREFYGKQGIKYTPANSTREEEILANAYANEIIEDSDTIEDIQKAADKLVAKGVNITNKEKLVLKNLIGEMESRKRISDLKSLGVKEEIYNSKEFRDFEKLFTKDTPISEVYNLYRTKTNSTKELDNPGSLKGVQTKDKKTFISEAEYDRMTEKEIEENMDLIRESMSKW